MVLSVIMAGSFVFAAENEKFSTLIVFKQDWAKPDESKGFTKQNLFSYWKKGGVGAGFDVRTNKSKNYLQFAPFLTLGKDPFYFLGGISTDSQKKDFVQTGVWYWDKVGKVSIFLDARNYYAISKEAISYLDVLYEITHPIRDSFYGGISGGYTHTWDNKQDSHLAGLLVGYNIDKKISLFARLARDWNFTKGEDLKSGYQLRLGLKIKF